MTITAAEVERYATHLKEEERAPATLEKYLRPSK